MTSLIAVVQIDGIAAVIVLAVFVLVFALVAVLAWFVVRNLTAKGSTDRATWRFSTNIPLPPRSRTTVDRLVRQARSRPSLTSEQQQFVAGLASTRKKLASGIRLAFVVAGLGGIGLSIAIYRDYRDEEMILLPVGIIFLLSVGVLMSGIVPSRVIEPIAPIDPGLFRNVHINVDAPSLTVQLDDATRRKAVELLERGLGPESVAREVTTGYERLSEAEKQEVQQAIGMLRER